MALIQHLAIHSRGERTQTGQVPVWTTAITQKVLTKTQYKKYCRVRNQNPYLGTKFLI